VQEVRQSWNSWAYQTVRLFAGARFLEMEHTVGPIDISDHLGKEVRDVCCVVLCCVVLCGSDKVLKRFLLIGSKQVFHQLKHRRRVVYRLGGSRDAIQKAQLQTHVGLERYRAGSRELLPHEYCLLHPRQVKGFATDVCYLSFISLRILTLSLSLPI